MSLSASFRRLSPAVLIAMFFIAVPARSQVAAGNLAEKPQEPSPSPYVGADTCKMCHEEVFNNLQKTRHWNNVSKTKDGAEVHSCETCHGPGAEHVNSGGDKTKIFNFKVATPKEVTLRCLACHRSGADHMNFSRSAHSENDLSCLSCHSSHHGNVSQFLLVKAQPSLCYTCHQKVKPQFNMPFHHRVGEGLVQCSDCHNPHGGFIGKQLRSAAARDSVCFTCHADKQGPFVFEHQPLRRKVAWPAILPTDRPILV